jgi:acyl-CoA thioesterase
MALEAVRPGGATLSMTVAAHMVNSHEVCHGGYIASLADSAFAYASNAYGEVTVASGFDIAFVAELRGRSRSLGRPIEVG